MNANKIVLVVAFLVVITADLTWSIPAPPPSPPRDLNEDQHLLESMIAKLKEAHLDKYVIVDPSSHNGSLRINMRALFYDERSLKVMIEFLREHGYPTPKFQSLVISARHKRNMFEQIGAFFRDVFTSIGSTIQQNFMLGLQSFLSGSIKDVLGQIEQTLFLGTPLNFSSIINEFAVDLKTSLRNAVVTTVENTFQQQALRLLDLQEQELNKLLSQASSNSMGPVQFVTTLQQVLEGVNGALKAFVPTVSDIIGQQLNTLLTQLLNAVPPEISASK